MAFALLHSPALTTGLLADDYVHRLILTGSAELPAYHQPWTRLFQFATPHVNGALRDDGMLAWWADMDLKYAFFRPVSAITHAIDYALWPRSSVLMHAHSMAWAALGLIAVGLLYRQLFKHAWMVGLGMLFYAFDPTRAVAVAWIANRNALIACTFSVFALTTFVMGIRGNRTARWASPLLFAAALMSSEGGFGAAGYLLGAALFLDQGPLVTRLRKLAPHAILAVAILATSRALGFGVLASGAYFDPLRDTASYLSALPGRALALLAAAFGGPSADVWNAYELLMPGLATGVAILNLVTLGFWILVLTPLIRRSPTARFAATGAALALLPAAAAFPSDRLLGWVAIGVMALLVELFASFVSGRERSTRLAAGAAFAIIVVRLLFSPAALVAQSVNVNRINRLLERTNQAVPWSESVKNDDVVFINPPQDPLVVFVPPLRAAMGLPRPASLRWLATGLTAVAVRRTGERTLEVTQDGGFLRQHTEKLVRTAAHPLRVGAKVELPELTAEVLEETPDQRPLRVSFQFKQPLEASRLRWLAYRDGKYEPFLVPALGQCVELPANDFLAMTLGPENAFTRFFAARRHALTSSDRDSRDLCKRPPRT